MRKKVCMFVWNHFTNDARVLRECTALSESNYSVDLICIQDPKDQNLPDYEERNPFFHIYRVKRYPSSLLFLQKLYTFCRQSILVGLLMAIALFFLLYSAPYIMVPLIIIAIALLKTKVRVFYIGLNIILHMIRKGVKKNYDIYHANDLNTLPQAYICAKLRLKKRKLLYDSHEVQTSRTGYNSGLYGKVESFLIKRIDQMIVENHTRAKYNEELYGLYPHVVHNYPFSETEDNLEKVSLHRMLGLDLDEKILLYQGGIQMGRGLDKLIKATPLFKEGVLVLIGDGRIKPELEKMVEDLNLEERVKFMPKVPLADLPKYTRNAYLGFQVLNNVCFNHYSASSNKLFEYIMAGVPVVACSFPEIKKVVEGENIGICVDSHDYNSIADGVNYILSNEKEHRNYVQNSYKAKMKYNWDNESKFLLNVYELVSK